MHSPTRAGSNRIGVTAALAAAVALLGLTLSTPAQAQIPATYDGFDYNTGSLNGENGGTGDWKDSWSGDSQLRVETPGFTYTDSASNELTVSGNRVGKSGSANSTNKISRSINGKVNSGTVWVSLILDGRNGSRSNNFSLGDGLFMGQGTKDSGTNRIGLADADGNTAQAPSEFNPNDRHFLVIRVDFSGGNEEAWLWIDPLLDSEPSTAGANANLGSVKEFEFDFVQLQLQGNSSQVGIDEIRLGSSFAQVSPFTSSAVCGDGSVDVGEQCDNGPDVAGDCCSAACQFETLGSACGDPASDTCNAADTCNATGVCLDNLESDGTACSDGLFCNQG